MIPQQTAVHKSRFRLSGMLLLQAVLLCIVFIAMLCNAETSGINVLYISTFALLLSVASVFIAERSAGKFVLAPITTNAESVINLTQNIGHELGTAVAIFRSRLQVIERQAGEPLCEDDLTTLIDASERASALVNDLRFLLRPDAFECRRHLSIIYLDSLIIKCVNRFQSELSSRALTVELDLKSCVMVGDPELIDRLISNLLKNGIDHVRGNACIAIRLQKEGKNLVLTFADDGDGIPDHARNNIFDRAYSLQNSNNQTGKKNSGLGLAIAKSIVDAHNGKISLSTAASKGCHFRIEFPSAPIDHPFSNLILE